MFTLSFKVIYDEAYQNISEVLFTLHNGQQWYLSVMVQCEADEG